MLTEVRHKLDMAESLSWNRTSTVTGQLESFGNIPDAPDNLWHFHHFVLQHMPNNAHFPSLT